MRSSGIKKTKLTGVISVVLMAFFPVFSQQNSDGADVISPGNKESENVREKIFKDIMGTISVEKKHILDSASRVSKPQKEGRIKNGKVNENTVPAESLRQRQESIEESLRQLPEDVRKRVEKAIRDIEQRNEERRIELKEFREKR